MDKLGYMLETPLYWWYSSTVGTLTTVGSENPQSTRTISREVLSDSASQPDSMTPQRLHADSHVITRGVLEAYLQGALHDGTYNEKSNTHRFSQKGREWLDRLQHILRLLGHRSKSYREGANRDEMFALQTGAKFLDKKYDPDQLTTQSEQIAYVRGYFDAEGGMPRKLETKPFQIYLAQKNRDELHKVKDILLRLGILCGGIGNPSKSVDPDYWRFYLSVRSNADFARYVGSWHPRKEHLLKGKAQMGR